MKKIMINFGIILGIIGTGCSTAGLITYFMQYNEIHWLFWLTALILSVSIYLTSLIEMNLD